MPIFFRDNGAGGAGDRRGSNVTSVPLTTNDSATRLDLKVLEVDNVQESKKMRRDSFFHHIMDDALFKTRQRVGDTTYFVVESGMY